MSTNKLQPASSADLDKRIAALSPEQRALYELQLKQKRAERSSIAAIPRIAQRAVFPLSFAQERIWFLSQLQPGNPAYSVRSAIRMIGRLDVAALEQTFGEIVRRYEVLRTTFAISDGQPIQIVDPHMPAPLPMV